MRIAMLPLLVCGLLAWAAPMALAAVDSAPHTIASESAHHAHHKFEAASTSSAARHVLGAAEAEAEAGSGEIRLAGCQLTGFTLTARLAQQSQPFHMMLDTTLPLLFVADSAIQCSRASQCGGITPKFDAASSAALGTILTTYPDGSKWSGAIYAAPVEILSGAAGNVVVTSTPSLRFASLTSVLHSARGNFFRAGTCAAPADPAAMSYQGVAGFARGGGVAAASAVSVGTAQADSMWTDAPGRSTNAFTLSLCADSGRIFGGSSSSAAEHDRFLSLFASQMRFARMHNEFTGLYQLDVQSITVQPKVGSTAPQGLNATVSLPGVSGVLDSAASHWIMPGAVFDAVQALLATNPEFVAAFPNLDPSWWIDRVCVPAATGLSSTDLFHSLPRLVLMTGNGLGLSVSAVGSYLLPCNAERTLWAAGITRRDESVLSLQHRMSLGWPFLNHFVIHFDLDQQYLGFAPATACWSGTGSASGDSGGLSGWDGAGLSGAVVLGGLPGSCGTGAVLSFTDPECAPRATSNDTAATHCAAIILTPEEQEQGWALGSCGADIAEGASCRLGCAPGYTAEFSTAFWCERNNHTLQQLTQNQTLALTHGTQLCTPVHWEPLDPPLSENGPSMQWTVASDYPVQLNWSAPAVPFALQVDLQWVASDSGLAPLPPFNSTLVLAAPSSFSATSWSQGPTLFFRAPNVTSASIFRVQASMQGEPAGTSLLLKVLPMPPPPTPPPPAPVSSSTALDASSSSSSSTGSDPSSSSTGASSTAEPNPASSSSAGSSAAASTASAAPSSSSTGAAFDPRLVAASVFLDTSLLYADVSKDVPLFLASLRGELSAIVPAPRIADLRVAAHTDASSSSSSSSSLSKASQELARFSFVIKPADPRVASTEPSVEWLRDQLSQSLPAPPQSTGLVFSKVTRVESAMVAACDDGSYKTDCAAAGVADDGGVAAVPATTPDRAWLYAAVVVAAILSLIFCCCMLVRGRGGGEAISGDGSVRVTSSLPSTRSHRQRQQQHQKKKGRPSAPAVRKHDGDRFTIVEGDDLDAFEADEEEDEIEMDEFQLPTDDRSSHIDAVSIAINDQQSPRPPSPSRNDSSGGGNGGQSYGTPSRLAPPPAVDHDVPDFEMDAASDDEFEDELNQL